MIRSLLTALFISVNLCYAQDCEVYHKVNSLTNEISVIAENKTIMPYTVKLEANFKGMKSSQKFPLTQIVEANKIDTLAKFLPEKNTSISFGFNSTKVEGNILAKHNNDVVYELPYKKGTSFKIDQGYNGKSTHRNKNALDFHMDEGTEICAIRDGLVVKAIDEHKKGCPDESCAKFNNFVLVLHDDGSYADYSHLQKGGALVKVGDWVKSGQVIALSGKTGIASGPHLHLEVYTMTWDGQNSIAVRYMVDGKATMPVEGMSYVKK
ncbi:MAG: M23 family metallopeptidase [Cyclobacteriaceae bacterium]|nr:M23 family metallopeptidase [Cyclobacteriaceae bacterium SS2]